MTTHALRRAVSSPPWWVVPACSLVAGTVLAGAASAHVEPKPAAAEAGTTTTIQFNVEHGCDGSPTTKVEIKVPQQVTDVAAVDKPGWSGTVAGQVVTYTGGSQDAQTATDFGVKVTLPASPAKLEFPVVQTCEKGSIDWIEPTPRRGSRARAPRPRRRGHRRRADL